MYWHRSISLRGTVFWKRLSFLDRTRRPDPPERTRRFCESCGADTPHDSFDDCGYGWYARCGAANIVDENA
jgi:hypothetical protein